MIAKKMVNEIEAVRATMLDKFSGVDKRLTTIEQLLHKIIDSQNKIVSIPEKEKKAVIGEGDGGPSGESRAEIPWEGGNSYGWVGLYTNNQSDYKQKNEPLFGFCYRPDEGKVNERFVNSFGKADETVWGGKKFEKKRGEKVVSTGKKVVKASQDESFNDSLKSNQCGMKESSAKIDGLLLDSKKPNKRGKKDSVQNEVTGKCGGFVESDKGRDCSKLVEERTESEDGWGPKRKHPDCIPAIKVSQEEIFKDLLKSDQLEIKESCAGSSESWDKVANKTDADGEKTDVSLQDSSKPNQCGKKDSGSCGESVKNEITGTYEKGRDWSKLVEEKADVKDGWSPWAKNDDNKRKRNNSSVEWTNDGPSSSGAFTETKRHLGMFTSEEQEILNDIEPIMQTVRRILNPNEYNDGNPLSPDDQTFILDKIINHHPNKAQKIGAGVDYIMVSKHMEYQIGRCFYIVSLDGHKEEFSYKKCLQNFVREKYPDRANKFIPKYFKPNPHQSQPLHRFPGNKDNGPYEGGTHRFRPGYRGGAPRKGALHQTKMGVGGSRQGLKAPWRQMAAPRWGS